MTETIRLRELMVFLEEPVVKQLQAAADAIEKEKGHSARPTLRQTAQAALAIGAEMLTRMQAVKVEKAEASNLVQPAIVVPPGMAEAAERLRKLKEGPKHVAS